MMEQSAINTSSANVEETYQQRLSAAQAAIRRRERQSSALSVTALLSFLLFVAAVLNLMATGLNTWPWPMAVGVALIAQMVLHERVKRRLAAEVRVARHYELGLAHLEDRWRGRGQHGLEYARPPANKLKLPAWLAAPTPAGEFYHDDLDLFGLGSLFERLALTMTPAGRDRLAGLLTAPEEAGTAEQIIQAIGRRQEVTRELAPRLALREALVRAAATPWAQMMPVEPLLAWAETPPVTIRRSEQWAAGLISLLTLATLFALPWLGPGPFLVVIVIRCGLGWWSKGRIRQITGQAERKAQGLAAYAATIACFEKELFETAALRETRDVFGTPAPEAARQIRRLARLTGWFEDLNHNLVFLPVSALLFAPLHLAWAIERWRHHHGPAVRRWLNALGELEALTSLGAYAFECPGNAWPEFTTPDAAGGPLLEACGLAHPLLPAGAVRNDLVLERTHPLLILSGSNMSGKSTFLRTLGTNLILARAGAPVRAARLRLTPLRVACSIRTSDSLQDGISRFYAEILRIRQIVRLAEGTPPLLFLIDELLSGTNSHDRRIAAEAILRRLVELGALGLATTHDLALTAIAGELTPRAVNAHFEDQVVEGKILFDYRLRPGIIERGNALALMRQVGLDV